MTAIKFDELTVQAIEKFAMPLGGAFGDYDPIIKAAQGKHFVLIGEASHGTREFYRSRAEITMRLIDELEFDAIAVEADWPDAYEVNRYVSNSDSETSALDALKHFERFPNWMWANTEILHFIKWLADFNKLAQSEGRRGRPVGFFGLDLYSMSTSAHAVVEYLEEHDPDAALRAIARYSCLAQFIHKPQLYGQAAEFGLTKTCEREIVAQLVDLQKNAHHYITKKGIVDGDEYFCAEQNAKLVQNAEAYYRTMFRARHSSWNQRDKHMFQTLGDLKAHLDKRLDREAKIVVWAHNSHIGNAAATDMSRRGEFNIGQLAKEKYGSDALLVGFSTCQGEVTAASDWDAPAERKRVRPPFEGSYERLFHQVSHKRFMLDLTVDNEMNDLLSKPHLQRAIGVIYRPETERQSHYLFSCLTEQFDFLLHFDDTTALEPLNIPTRWHEGEMDETYPTGV
ncbi:MAG: erythromycin esterase family protein [Sneathiella sp.]|nr:erythromycin esterase family protein [Sneathiella sp.]